MLPTPAEPTCESFMPTKAALESLAELPSLGRVSAQLLLEAGIADATTHRRLGPIESYRRLRFFHGKRVSMNFVYTMECANCGMDWRVLGADRKAQLKAEARAVEAEPITTMRKRK